MDFAQALNELWRRPGWLVIGAAIAIVVALSTAYRISVFPPDLQQRTLSLGTATTQILVDTPDSALVDLGVDFEPLAERAAVFARLAESRPVREAVAKEVGASADQIYIRAPIDGRLPRDVGEGSRERRIGTILEENRGFRLSYLAQNGLPSIIVSAEAPRVEDAIRLANAGATGFQSYVERVQAQQRVPKERRVAVRQLGDASGGLVAKEINRQLLILAFIATFIGWCLLMLAVSGVAKNLRAIRASEGGQAQPDAPPGGVS